MISVPILIVIAAILAAVAGYVAYQYYVSPQGNEAPVISIEPITNATVGQTILINATVTDDGSIITTVWDQESGPQTNITQVAEDMYFTPNTNGSYLFSIEVQDDKQAISEAGFLVDVKGIPTDPIPEPPPKPTCTVNQVYNPVTNKCDPKPTPPPVAKDIKVTVVGDIEDGTSGNAVFEQIKKQNADYDFVLGDLGYESNLDWFKETYGTLGDKMWCVMGNHEADNEDGSSALEKETLEFCGNSYWIRNGVTLFLMYNTNDNQNTLIDATKKVFSNQTIMNGVKNIHINGHKGCETPPNSHHPAGEIKTLCDYLSANIPSGIKPIYNSAHNHVVSFSADGKYVQSGAGGRSHYTCGTNTAFPYCNNSSYGFVLYTIKIDGTTTAQFIDYNGVVKR